MDTNTPIEDLKFKEAWRVKRAVKVYNLSKDKPKRIETLGDLKDYKVIDFLGVGPKTTEYLKAVLASI